jgi:hypothetical protein
VIRPIVMGPTRTRAIRVVSIIRFTLMTICNLPLWEFSRINLVLEGLNVFDRDRWPLEYL